MDIRIRPNPVNDELFIQLYEKWTNDQTRLNILNLNGQLIRTINILSNLEQKIEVADLKQGVYILDFRNDIGHSKIIKLIKL